MLFCKNGMNYCSFRECARLSDPIDRKVIEFMFDVCGQGADRMRFTDILRFSDDEPVLFNKKLRELQVAITEEVRDSELFEPKGDRARLRMTVLASALVVIGCVFIYLQQSFIPLVAFFTGAGLVVLISGRMPRRTDKDPAVRGYFFDCETQRNR